MKILFSSCSLKNLVSPKNMFLETGTTSTSKRTYDSLFEKQGRSQKTNLAKKHLALSQKTCLISKTLFLRKEPKRIFWEKKKSILWKKEREQNQHNLIFF